MGWRTLGAVRNGSRDPMEGLGWVGGNSGMFQTSRGPLERSGTGWGTLGLVRDGSRDPRKG